MRGTVAKRIRKHVADMGYPAKAQANVIKVVKRTWNATPRNRRAKLAEQLS